MPSAHAMLFDPLAPDVVMNVALFMVTTMLFVLLQVPPQFVGDVQENPKATCDPLSQFRVVAFGDVMAKCVTGLTGRLHRRNVLLGDCFSLPMAPKATTCQARVLVIGKGEDVNEERSMEMF